MDAIPTKRKVFKVNLQFIGIQSAYWICFFCLSGFVVVQLQEKGFSNSQIGILIAVQAIASIFAQPIISSFAEKHRNIPLKFWVALQLAVSMVAVFSLYFLRHSMIAGLAIFIVLGVSIYSSMSIINAIAMQLTNADIPINYGMARGFGSLMFAVSGIFIGRLVEKLGVDIIIPAFIISSIVAIIIVATIYSPRIPKEIEPLDTPKKAYLGGFISFFREKRAFTGFCIASIFLFANHACLNTYIPNIVTSLGGGEADQGIVRSIAAFVELPIMIASAYFAVKFKPEKLLIFSSFFFAVKGILTLFSGSLGMLFLVQIIQMPAFGLYFPLSVIYANKIAGDNERVRAQAYATVAGMGVGMVAGNLIGGALLDYFPVSGVLIASAIFGFLGFIIMFISLSGHFDSPRSKASGNSAESLKTA